MPGFDTIKEEETIQ